MGEFSKREFGEMIILGRIKILSYFESKKKKKRIHREELYIEIFMTQITTMV